MLRAALSDYPQTLLLKTGELARPDVRFEFPSIHPIHKAFAPMVRQGAYDLCELAIVTALQAVAYDRPVIVLPIVVASRFQRSCLISLASKGPLRPEELATKRIAVRAYTQTTGMWVRAHLEEDYGLPIESMTWVTQMPAHVEEYRDPPNVVHVGRGESLLDMLHSGAIDAVIMGNDLPGGDDYIPVIPEAAAKDHDWWQRHRFMPINHMVAVSQEAAARAPDAIRAAYRLLVEAEAATRPPPDEPSRTMCGFEALRIPIEKTIGHCRRQGLLPEHVDVEAVLGPAVELLGADVKSLIQ